MTRFAALLAVLLSGAASAADRELVRVNGVAIRQSEVLDRLLRRHGAQTVDEMIDELLLRQAAASRKLKTDQGEVERRFKRLEKQFGSRELLVSQLEQAGTSIAKVKEDLSEEVLRERLIAAARGIKVSEDELKQAFEQNREKLGKPESAHLRHILVKTKAEADELAAKVKGGADFQALARERSLAASGKAAGGDYGFVSRGMLPPEIDEIAFALKDGETRVVAGARGFHLLQSLGKKPAEPAKLAEVKEDLRELMMAERIKAAAPSFLQELRSKADIQMLGGAAAAKP